MGDGPREKHDGLGKNDRNHTSCIDSQRDVGGLTTVDATSHDPLCVLYRNPPLALRHQHHCSHNGDHEYDEEQFLDEALGEATVDEVVVPLALHRVG